MTILVWSLLSNKLCGSLATVFPAIFLLHAVVYMYMYRVIGICCIRSTTHLSPTKAASFWHHHRRRCAPIRTLRLVVCCTTSALSGLVEFTTVMPTPPITTATTTAVSSQSHAAVLIWRRTQTLRHRQVCIYQIDSMTFVHFDILVLTPRPVRQVCMSLLLR